MQLVGATGESDLRRAAVSMSHIALESIQERDDFTIAMAQGDPDEVVPVFTLCELGPESLQLTHETSRGVQRRRLDRERLHPTGSDLAASIEHAGDVTRP